ncbi:MAG: 50S ribosomal protein L17 [Planctomycetota bacterium]|nr:50S ribosomal protein L17 [Planctomycetota bacterium]
MRHRKFGRKLGRTTSHRKATLAAIVRELIIRERIITTVEKAKESARVAEHMITLGKRGGLECYRRAVSELQHKPVVEKLFKDIAVRYADRAGGYTRVLKLGGNRWDGEGKGKWAANRLGDNGRRAILELVARKEVEAPAKKGKEKKPAK